MHGKRNIFNINKNHSIQHIDIFLVLGEEDRIHVDHKLHDPLPII